MHERRFVHVQEGVEEFLTWNPSLKCLIARFQVSVPCGYCLFVRRTFLCIDVGHYQSRKSKTDEKRLQAMRVASSDLEPRQVAPSQIFVWGSRSHKVRNKNPF